MTADVVFAVGGALALAAMGYVFCPEWFRKRKPMPALKRRVPGLPVDGEVLTTEELWRLSQLEYRWRSPCAQDPMEQR